MNKNTQELLRSLKHTKNIEAWLTENAEIFENVPLWRYLERLIAEKGIKKSQCIQNALLQRNYGYQIFSGERTPSRDKVIALCLAMGLTPEEAHSLLCHTGFSDIYPKNRRDSVLIFALERKLTVLETNELLYELGEELL